MLEEFKNVCSITWLFSKITNCASCYHAKSSYRSQPPNNE